MGIFKLGNIIKFIPHTITVGFTAGIALTILIGQLKYFFGLTYAYGVRPIEAFEKFEANIEAISTFSPGAFLVGAVCLAILIMVAYNMSEWRKFKLICQTSPWDDTVVMVVTFALTVIFDIIVAIEAGLLLAGVFH